MSSGKIKPIFFLLPFVVFGQFTVVDGPDIDSDIDTQSSTSLYQGTFDAPDSIWTGYAGFKQYLCRFYLKDSGDVIYSLNYPEVPDYSIPELPLSLGRKDTFWTGLQWIHPNGIQDQRPFPA